MHTLTIKSPKTLNFCTNSPVKERKLEMLPNGEVSLLITYQDGTDLTFKTDNGSIRFASNQKLLLESTEEQTNLKVIKNV